MPRIFDNIDQSLLPALTQTLRISNRADFAVGYFNLRGWKCLDSHIQEWPGGENHCCRLLVGMQQAPDEQLRTLLGIIQRDEGIDQQTAFRLKKQLAVQFRDQLTVGIPSNEDEAGLRRLAAQLRAQKLVVKLFLRHNLHAKLYLMHRSDPVNPIVGYLGSSNLTMSGLSYQGELNIDVLDGDATQKLAKWFNDRWDDRWCLDISEEIIEVIDESWAREEPIPPHHIYVKMAYHLSQEARAGLAEFRIPKIFGSMLFDYQTAAVKIAARHLNKRGGVLIGDVVGLGKSLMATAVARIFEDDFGMQTLILSPKNLVPMWEQYREKYELRGRVLSITQAIRKLPTMKRYKLVLIDESHNLRNRDGKVYRAIREYIEQNECYCILLTATPYNKSYLDLSNQLRLFIPEDKDLGIRPEHLLRDIGEDVFQYRHNCSPRSLAAFEKSGYAEDWRELMRLFMVRRTRSFIMDNYAQSDPLTERQYLTFDDGRRNYFPTRRPKTLKFEIDAQYASLFSPEVVDIINGLSLPRYGLGNYEATDPRRPPTANEAKALQDLSRAGQRLMGFCRTNLFKRLESSGEAFLLSVERHILRNYIFLHAIENSLDLPIGPQAAELLDSRITDSDEQGNLEGLDDSGEQEKTEDSGIARLRSAQDFRNRSGEIYEHYHAALKTQFRWLPNRLFKKQLADDLKSDTEALIRVLDRCSQWEAGKDNKLATLRDLLAKERPNDKILIFTQFADTARYLEKQLAARGIQKLAVATGGAENVTQLAWRFSPASNDKRREITNEHELRVLVATDVLSEGQNLQDCFVIVNYDLPWAIIRLIQRAGRVDRIGQKAEEILCYSFLPADGVENIIKLRKRVKDRLVENHEVVGSDELFFEDDDQRKMLAGLYDETAKLDGDEDAEVDLASYAYEIWNTATKGEPNLAKTIPEMPAVVFSTKQHETTTKQPNGVLVYLSNTDGTDALAWVDTDGRGVTQSQYAILKAAECLPETPAISRLPNHHNLVGAGVELIVNDLRSTGGQLGKPSSAKFRVYHRLKAYAEQVSGTLFDQPELHKTIEEMLNNPLTQTAADRLNSHLRSGISDEMLVQLALLLRAENRLCIVSDDTNTAEPKIICSMGLR